MESSYGPNSSDEPSLLYKLQRKIKVFNSNNPLPNRGYNLVASSSKYALVFIGTPDGILTVYHLKDLIDNNCEPHHAIVNLKERPTHIAVSCDQELLAVTGGQLLSVFNISNFQNPNPQSIDIRLDKGTTFVSGLQWNPCMPDNLAMVFFDGSLLVANISASPQLKMVQTKARCLCWSPKGKQIVTGNSDGTLSQFKPDLTPAKNIPGPKLFGGAPIEALAVYWISTFMFAVVYKNTTDNSRPVVTIVNTPKGNPAHCLNYEDICFSMGTNRPWYYYLQAIPQWSIIMASSSNSMEIATLGSQKDGENWIQWCQSDEARPELPLTDKKIENFPIGVWIDTTAIHHLPWGENACLPPMPLLHVLTHNGLLTIFNVINLNKDVPQICVPPQLLTLPAAAMTSVIPGEVPAPSQPAPVQAQPTIQAPVPTQPTIAQQIKPQQVAAAPPAQYNAGVINVPKPPSYAQTQINKGHTQAPVQEQKPVEIKPTPVAQTKTAVAPTPQTSQPVAPKAQTPQQIQENAALKAEQERASEMRANQELKNMLVKEVNDFQKELYNFMVKTRETQAKLQRDINTINANYTGCAIDSEQLRKECSLEDLRTTIVQLKLELVRACAVVAEARTHAEAKDCNQWTQADPLTTKRVASVKKLAYYVQSQLVQAQKALDYKWNEALAKDPQFNKPGQHMIRPILDDVYQPLVKQQEILSRQQAVLRTLRNALKECDVTPMFKSTSLLRSTPFKNKDPLSKLTKNILNMSLEPEKPKEPLLSSQKLDALRDMLSNHKTIKIKPVNVELRQQLAAMKLNYENSLKEKAQIAVQSPVDLKPPANLAPPIQSHVAQVAVKIEPKQEPSPITVPSFTPVGGIKPTIPGLNNVARTLFTDEPKQVAHPKPVTSAFAAQYSPITPATQSPASPVNTRSLLQDLLQSKPAGIEVNIVDAKNDGNMFMGHKICSPSSFSFAATTPSANTAAVPAAKSTSDIDNIFNKFLPQSFAAETQPAFSPESKTLPEPKLPSAPQVKPQTSAQPQVKPHAFGEHSQMRETGEDETTVTKTITLKPKTVKPTSNLLETKTVISNVPDVLQTTQEVPKSEAKTVTKPVEKENKPQKSVNTELEQKLVKADNKAVTLQINKSIFGPVPQPVTDSSASTSSAESSPTETKSELNIEINKVTEKRAAVASSASSIFATGNATILAVPKPAPLTITSKPDVTSKPEPVTPASTPVETSSPPIFSATTSLSAASVFGSAVAKQTSQASSIFASTTPSSVFGSSSQSIFGSSNTSVFSGTTPASADESKPSEQESTSSVFEVTTTTTTSGSIFGTSVFATSTASTTTAPTFASSTTSLFATTTTKASVFSTPTTTAQPSIFSSVPSTTATALAGSQPSAFDTTTATTQSTVFGSSGGSVFAAAKITSNQTSIFGAQPAVTQSTSLFATATATSPASVFSGQNASTPGSVFGTPTATTQTSIFGSPTATNQSSLFGSPTATTQSSIFGTSTATTQVSVFGTPTATTKASIFGSPPAITQASAFGTAPAQSSVFGTSEPAAGQTSSLFGGGESNLFAAASISTTSSPSQSLPGSVFGSSNTNVFGGNAAFGQANPTAASIFGGGGATSFGQKPAGNPWAFGGGNTEGGFGSPSGGFGQQATTQASSVFGGNTGGSFSTPTPSGQAFGSPQPAAAFGGSTGFGSNQSVFGSSASFGSPSGGFGSPFGGGFNKSPSSGFGGPAFGGGATFGGGAAFGSTSPSKGFGGSAPAPAFSTNQSNATFESLATQNTLSFGNLAQQSGPPPQPATSFNTSPSFTGWRG